MTQDELRARLNMKLKSTAEILQALKPENRRPETDPIARIAFEELESRGLSPSVLAQYKQAYFQEKCR